MLVNIHEAKTQFSKLINQALSGEEVIIARGGKAVIQLVPYSPEPAVRRGGQLRGLIEISEDFDESLPDDLLRLFYEEEK